MFIVVEGHGTLRVAGEMLPIRTGDVIFIPPGPDYPHQIINTSDAPLKYLSVSTSETPEIFEYPDSGEIPRDRRAATARWRSTWCSARRRASTTGTASREQRGAFLLPPDRGGPVKLTGARR